MSGLNPIEDFHSHPFFGPVGLGILLLALGAVVVLVLLWRSVERNSRENAKTRIVLMALMPPAKSEQAQRLCAEFDALFTRRWSNRRAWKQASAKMTAAIATALIVGGDRDG